MVTIDGNDLAALLNTQFEENGGGGSEYNVYTVALPGPTFAALADGTATLVLNLQGPGAGGSSNNGAHIVFSTLTVESGPPPTFTLTVDGAGDGNGSVTDTTINCTINADAQFVAQYLVGLRDEFYNLVP